MVLKHLSSSMLQHKIGESVLDRLEMLLPAISVDLDPTDIYRKETLVKILGSFSNERLFKDKEFFTTLINSLPQETLKQLAARLSIEFTDFEQTSKQITSRGWRSVEFCRNFCEATNLPSRFVPSRPSKFLQSEVAAACNSPYKRLKTYQTSVFERAKEKSENRLARFVIQMPTGSGKTRTAMELVAEALNDSPGKCVVWLAHSSELCEQAIECFRHVWSHVGKIDANIYRCWGKSDGLPFDNPETTFLVCGFQKLNKLLEENQQPFSAIREKIALLIIDEAHKVVAPTYQAVTQALIGEATTVIGLTATPGRSIVDEEENKKLSEFFFEEKITISVPGNGNVIEYLRDKGVLSRVVREPLLSQRTYELTSKQKKYMEKKFDFPPELLRMLSDDDVRNLEIIQRLKDEAEDGKKILFFACSVEHSKFICAVLTYFQIVAKHVDGTTSTAEREDILSSFKEGSVNVVCNYGVLTTGFDAPKTDVVFIARPTASIVLYSQMIGRGLRGPIIGGTESCKVIEVVDNIVGMPTESRIFDYFDDYWVSEKQ